MYKTTTNKSITINFKTKEIFIAELNLTLSTNAITVSRIPESSKSKLPVNATHWIVTNKGVLTFDSITADDINKDFSKFKTDRKIKESKKLENNCPGVELLRNAYNAESVYLDRFAGAMEDEYNDGVNMPVKPAQSSDDLVKIYPKAALYLKAEGYSEASNYKKSGAGYKAMQILKERGNEKEAQSLLDNWLSLDDCWG